MAFKETVRNALGELILTGFRGLELSEGTSSFFSKARIGGVILFAHNFENPTQVAELTHQVQGTRTDFPLWVSVDHEGGKVQRFKKGFTRIPEAAAVGAMQSPQLAFQVAEVMAKELKSVGINLNFSPVADIATNPENPVIGSRSYGSDEKAVSKVISEIIRGHLVNGVQPCVKHFPGHGDTSTDSHFALPRVDTSLETMLRREFLPFLKAIKSNCSLVMTAHILCTQIDPTVPATFSKIILQDILRKELHYEKVIISDDLEMKAIADHFGAGDAPRLALQAGCDLLTYRTEETSRQAYEALVHDLENGTLASEIVLAAESRIKALKKEFFSEYQPVVISDIEKNLNTSEYQSIIQKIKI